MAGPVDFSAFHHHEKAGFIIQHLNAFFHIISKRPFLLPAIQLIGHGAAVCQMFIDNDDLPAVRAQRFRLRLCFYHLVACVFRQCVKILLILIFAGCLQKASSGKIIKAALNQLQADVIIAASGRLMRIKCGRRGMV